MKFAVITFPGSNCDDDMVYVLGDVLGRKVAKIWHKETDLGSLDPSTDGIILPGGFSYGDYLRSGAIARFSPIMPAVIDFANMGGIVFGICNGFQILCEAHLLPGALLRNSGQQFIARTIPMKCTSTQSPLTQGLSTERVYRIPVAHAEGRYYADEDTLDRLEANGQVLFKYCNENGEITSEGNPNGSSRSIAGICNEKRNVIGMMPHPERAAEELLGLTDGLDMFRSLIEATVGV